MKVPTRIALVVVVVFVLAASGVAVARLSRTRVEQPIAFNHRLHVTELGNECTDCHLYAENGVRATIPNLEVCSFCHEEAQTDSPEEAKVVDFVQKGQKIPWRKVYWVPSHVYFSHRRHTAIAGLACSECHGAMEERELPVSERAVPVTMNGCIACHDQKGARNDCVLCHR